MKLILVALLGVFLVSPIVSQNKQDLIQLHQDLVDKGGDNLAFSFVEQVPNKNKQDLYYSAKTFFVENFKSAKNVIQLDDKDLGVVAGKGNFKHSFSQKMMMTNFYHDVTYYFYLKIQCKDGRYKVELNNITYIDRVSGSNIPMPETDLNAIDDSFIHSMKDKNAIKITYNVLDGASETINKMLSAIKRHMSSSRNIISDDNW